jgi:hypothetical protein
MSRRKGHKNANFGPLKKKNEALRFYAMSVISSNGLAFRSKKNRAAKLVVLVLGPGDCKRESGSESGWHGHGGTWHMAHPTPTTQT